MHLPRLSGSQGTSDISVVWKGYNRTDMAGRGEFSDMQNMTGDRFPLLCPRKPRGTLKELTKANGLIAREKLMWADGTELYYNNEKIADVTDGEKRFINYGAYVLIFPDKTYYNTADGTYGSMENEYKSGGAVSWKQTYLTETDLDGEGQIYIQISAAGIDEGFRKGDGVELTGFREEALNGYHVIKDIGEDWIKIIAAIDEDGSQTAEVTVSRKLPEMDFYTVSGNRLWGCSSKNHEIYASQIGSPFNFYVFEGLASDSYGTTIATDGDFTGAVTYAGYVLFFKENSVSKIYGTKPSNFQVIEAQLRGVEKGSENSLAIVNEVLYYKSAGGVMSFQGGMPYDVGAAIEKGYRNAYAGTVGDKYYVSMENKQGHSLFVYDTTKELWHKEDHTAAKYFTKRGTELYFLDGDTIKIIEPTEAAEDGIIEWFAETTDYTYQTDRSKFISRISLRCEVPPSAAMEIWIRYDSRGEWILLESIGTKTKNISNIPIIPKRCDHFRLKFAGYGDCVIHEMTIYLTTGSMERRR